MSASLRLGRCQKLRRAGRPQKALQAARKGLSILRSPVVRRLEGAEGSLVVVLTMQVEELARELGESGADRRDLTDSIECLRSVLSKTQGRKVVFNPGWLTYLEARLAQVERP